MRLRSRAALVVSVLALPGGIASACSDGAGVQVTGIAASPVGMASWSRSAAPHAASGAEMGDAAPPLATSPDLEALQELVSGAPRDAGVPTGEDGGTLVGTDTRQPPPDAAPAPPQVSSSASARAPHVGVGEASIQAGMSSPAIERAARAQLYWGLTQRCRDKEGKILPPDVVTLQFTIDRDGAISGSSIVASASEPRYDDAAQCMRRELSAATFEAPASARGVATRITATIPSVD
jgi:hypothetical protein